MSVCLSVCLSECLSVSLCLFVRSHNSKTTNFVILFVHVAVAASFSDGVKIYYELLALRMRYIRVLTTVLLRERCLISASGPKSYAVIFHTGVDFM